MAAFQRIISVSAVFVALVIFFAGLAFAQNLESQASWATLNLTPQERTWLSENNDIIVATDPTMQPLDFIDENNNISGITGDYLNLIANKLSVNFVWSGSRNWGEAMSQIRSKEAHLITGATNLPERREFLSFTDTYLNISHVIFAPEGGNAFGNMDALSGYKISQIKGFAFVEGLKKAYQEIEVVEVATLDEALRLVADGDVDAYVGNISITSHHIREEGFLSLRLSVERLTAAKMPWEFEKNFPFWQVQCEKQWRPLHL